MRVNLSSSAVSGGTQTPPRREPAAAADTAQTQSSGKKPEVSMRMPGQKQTQNVSQPASVMQGGETKQLTEEEEREILEKTLEIIDLIAPNRSLKYELIDDADIVQVQVVNTDDGSVVRKIPSDEVIERIKQIHELLSERLDVKA